MKRRIAVTTGTRAEYGILRSLLQEINQNKKLELLLAVTGTHLSKEHGMTIKEIMDDGFSVTSKIKINTKVDSLFDSTVVMGKLILNFAQFFKNFKPHINVVLGDRYEMFASAIAAYQMNIPNAHIHGGDKSGGLDEYTRHAITKISNIHFAATKKSAERIKKMGENPKNIFHTGSLSIDEILNRDITKKETLEEKYRMKFTGKDIVVLQHPVTTEFSNIDKQISETILALSKIRTNIIIIGPNSDAGHKSILEKFSKFKQKNHNVKFFSNIPRQDFLGFLENCGVLIGNSSSGIIEASLFKIPVINIGNRQKNREHGPNVINVPDFSHKKIEKAIFSALNKKKSELKISRIYGNQKVSKNISDILEKINLDNIMKKELRY